MQLPKKVEKTSALVRMLMAFVDWQDAAQLIH